MRAAVLIALAGCGRIGFDAGTSEDGNRDGEPAQIDAALVAPENLVAYYPMELLTTIGENQRVDDTTGHGHDGLCDVTAQRCPAVVSGKHGNGFRFTANQIFEVPSTAALELRSAFTIGVWMQLAAAPGPSIRSCAATKPYGAGLFNNAWTICVQSDQTLWFYTVGNSQPSQTATTATVSIGNWHHVAIRWNGTNKDIFVDGVRITRDPVGATDFDGESIWIGGDLDASAPSDLFDGVLDDLAIYDRALLESEVRALAE